MNPNTPLVLGGTGISMLVCVVVALAAPADVISSHPVLQGYTGALRAVIPGIDRLARVSSFPEVTQLVVSLMWTGVVILTGVYLLKIRVFGEPWARARGNRFYLTFLVVVVALGIVLLAVLHDLAPQDLQGGMLNERLLRGLSTSRLSLGMIAGFFGSGIALLLYVLLRWLRDFRTIYFAERGGDGS